MKKVLMTTLLSLVACVSFAKPNAIALKPVLSVTMNNGMITILGNMPLPQPVPADHAQQNAVVFPATPNAAHCFQMAQDSMNTGKGFQVSGQDSSLYATNGVFTMQFSAVTNCLQF